ncbi:TPA: hypothetical protein N2R10_004985, partial [Citrobacter freundii]|nr:hypothetical protein [Citrobacter freundii]
MFHLDNNSGVSAMPPVGTVQSSAPRWFTEGGGGTPASYPGADWYNIIQAELLNFLSAYGIAPDKADLSQLQKAIEAAIKDKATAKSPLLTAIAALVTSADKMPYFNGKDTVAMTALTAFAREVLAQTDAAGVLSKLGLGKTDSPEFGGLKAPSITLRDGKISLTSSTDGTTLVFTVSGEPVAEIKTGSFFHKKIISAGEVLQSPKYIFRDGDIIFYSGQNNLVMQVGGKDVATLTPENFYHVKQVAAAESLSAPKVILRPGDVNLISGKNNL